MLFKTALNLIQQRRIDYVILEYTPMWVTEGRGPWVTLLPRLVKLGVTHLFSLHRLKGAVYSLPLDEAGLREYHDFYLRNGRRMVKRMVQTDVLACFVPPPSSLVAAAVPWVAQNGIGLH